ncbi:hypothetical protein KKF32_01030 [Patescibacteria group bacterium]|nr:hypothetical protein [Patescibacteria group bacterium]
MNIKNLILIIVAVLNFILGIIIFSKNKKNIVNILFVLLMLGVSLWSMGLALSRELAGTLDSLNWSRSTYFSSLFIGLILFYFSVVFPYSKKISFYNNILGLVPFVFLSLMMILKSDFIIKEMLVMPWGYDNVYMIGYPVFLIVLIYYFVLSFINFIRKYLNSEGIIRIQLRFIIISFGIASIFGIIFDLILPYYNYWKLNWLGPYFTIIVLFLIFYLIFYKPTKNI